MYINTQIFINQCLPDVVNSVGLGGFTAEKDTANLKSGKHVAKYLKIPK